LILLDPNVLFDVGFQLSYLAVFGIVLLQKPIANLIQVKNKMLIWLWTMFTISVAAQLITFPLSILYFNQFPNFFWLSNYFVIPATTFIIWLTFGFFVLSPLPAIPDLLAQLIQLTTHLMLALLKWISELPHAVSEGIVFSQVQVCILYGLIAAFVVYGFSKNKTWLFGGLFLLICFQISTLWTKSVLFNQKTVYVYNSKNTLIQFINGRASYILSDGPNPVTEQEMNMIQNVSNHLKLEKPQLIDLKTTKDFDIIDFKIKDRSITFLNCRIDFLNKAGKSNYNNDILEFRIHNIGSEKAELTKTNIATGNTYFSKNNAIHVDFQTKLNGACFLDLKQMKPILQAMNDYH
jgi:competence protein ComEC